ncbi:hypothetical protein [Streptomyces broussonetiae]|uniref:hypothetical protein n=1 Tax=Streptomyces broussonetiae TaxID=2686304 RepID=UPI0035D6B0D1
MNLTVRQITAEAHLRVHPESSAATDTSHVVSANPAAAAAGLGDEVDHLHCWDQGHGANDDPGDSITWIDKVTGHHPKKR